MATDICDLTGNWQFKQYPHSARRMRDLDSVDSGPWHPATVPSSIYSCLIQSDQIDQAEIRTHPERFAWVSERSWIFRKVFDASGDLLGAGCVDLVFKGLDTVTQIWLNDKLVAKTDNMFIPYRFDVTSLVTPGKNTLLVKFASAGAHAEKLMHRYGCLSDGDLPHPHRTYVRKGQYQFGWDFCPSLPGCGIWQDVYLEAHSTARIENVHVRTIDCNEHYADIAIAVQVDTSLAPGRKPSAGETTADVSGAGGEPGRPTDLECTLNITGGGLDISESMSITDHDNRQSTVIRIDRPIMWWPKGYGIQHLYKLTAELTGPDGPVDRITTDFAVRTVNFNREKDRHGQKFQLQINHQPIFVKGANWLPISIFPASATPQDYENLLTLAADANINMLRVWGGGYYETDHFYRLCDRLGIMVWQDFMFACNYYPDRKWFLDAIEVEADSVIKRLRNHGSIVLWCGNNEIDWLHAAGKLGNGKKFYGKKIYHQILPEIVSRLDPDRDYIPTTPLGPPKDENNPASGTLHQWNVWSGNFPARQYTAHADLIGRFVTEFGMQSLPQRSTIETFCPESELHIASCTIEKHNYQIDGNSRLRQYLAELFAAARDLDELIYLTQLTQARRAKMYVEHLRAHRQINSGVLFWQFNDCSAAITWSAVDYMQRPKALYYYARRFFAPVMLTIIDDCQYPRPDISPRLQNGHAVVINDSASPLTAILTCELIELDGTVLDRCQFPAALAPNSIWPGVKLPSAFQRPKNPQRCLLRLSLQNGPKQIAENIFFYLPDKYIEWPKPDITVKIDDAPSNRSRLTITSDVVVRDLQINPVHYPAVNDNFITLLPGAKYEIVSDLGDDTASQKKPVPLRYVQSAV